MFRVFRIPMFMFPYPYEYVYFSHNHIWLCNNTTVYKNLNDTENVNINGQLNKQLKSFQQKEMLQV